MGHECRVCGENAEILGLYISKRSPLAHEWIKKHSFCDKHKHVKESIDTLEKIKGNLTHELDEFVKFVDEYTKKHCVFEQENLPLDNPKTKRKSAGFKSLIDTYKKMHTKYGSRLTDERLQLELKQYYDNPKVSDYTKNILSDENYHMLVSALEALNW